MKDLLEKRIAVILVIFGAFSYILIKLIDIKNTSWDIASLAMLISTAISLVLSLFLIPRLTIKRIMYWAIFCLLLLGTSIWVYYQFQKDFIHNTVILEEFQGDSTVNNKYFVGNVYTEEAKRTIKYLPKLKDNKTALLSYHDKKVGKVWEPDSIRMVELNLSFEYFGFVILLISTITVAIEIISKRQIQIQTRRAGKRPLESQRKRPASASEWDDQENGPQGGTE